VLSKVVVPAAVAVVVYPNKLACAAGADIAAVPPELSAIGVVAVNVVNAPAAGAVSPIAVPSIAPPVIATLLAFWDAIVPSPGMLPPGTKPEAVRT